jgi:SAM-dependent methyltransferase
MGASALGRQFGHPRGLAGRLVGRFMARGNAGFNTWVVAALREGLDPSMVTRVIELGPGPGVGLACLLDAFPHAQVWGVDQSSTMLGQARRRNKAAVRAGRLQLVQGDASAAQTLAPLDLIVAVHVLYFLRDPVQQLTRLREALAPSGMLALGFQLRQNMPKPAQEQFPRAGHRLYDSDDEVRLVLTGAGFTNVDIAVKGPADAPHGRLALASRQTARVEASMTEDSPTKAADSQ